MRGTELFEKITDIDDKLIACGASTRSKNIVLSKKVGSSHFIKTVGAVACLVLAASVVALIYTRMPQEKIQKLPEHVIIEENLPILTLSEHQSEGMGFEGYGAFDIEDLVNNNPWDPSLDYVALPVFKNTIEYGQNEIVQNPDYDLMKDMLIKTAEALSIDMDIVRITDDVPSKEDQKKTTEKYEMIGADVPDGIFNPSRFFVETEEYLISIDTTYRTDIHFKTPITLPNRYDFSTYASYEEYEKVAKYLEKEYRNLIDMEEPEVDISGGDFNIYVEQKYALSFYEGSGDAVDRIVQYNFDRFDFYGNENGDLRLARNFHTDLTDLVGNYPIINVEEATQLLIDGNYITTVPQAFEDETMIQKVELIYRTGGREEYFIPYYRFYVELKDQSISVFSGKDTGLNVYGAYYVPAIEGKYIENMPLWDGHFN